ncbi:hypothetical protein H072_7870 [Dactylellina haptotyla CBS 200.50]|uniref:F-box domain-containing protein n=1 Tax=Dactylellina haptotyla (strain CBS 200.50) TaxID=1284197 RepID=S8BGH9_DACHA|nr:hypothetical protein H072_7870 [Dactylellina haptotyla CBS 200.50]
MLYRVLNLHYDLSPEAEGFRNHEIDNIFKTSFSTFRHFKWFRVRATDDFLGMRDDIDKGCHTHLPASETTSLVQKAMQKFQNGQLSSVRFETETSLGLLAYILSTQSNLKDLQIGDVYANKYSLQNAQIQIPSLISDNIKLQLESLAFSEIQPQMLATMQGLLRKTSNTLRRLQIGHSEYKSDPDLDRWSSWRVRWGHEQAIRETLKEELRANSILTSKFALPSLEQLYILNDTDATRLLEFIAFVTDNGQPYKNLVRLRLSSCYYNSSFLEKIIQKAPNIQSLQISFCSFPSETIESILPSMKPLHTLQISRCFDADLTDWLPVNFHRQSLRRLWLECTYNCDPNLCPSLSKFWDPLINPYPLSSENWPLLEELAVGYPGWSKIPCIKSLKILRLLPERQQPEPYRTEESIETQSHAVGQIQTEKWFRNRIQNYAEDLCRRLSESDNEPPNLRVVVLERTNLTCIRSNTRVPCYFTINYKRNSGAKSWSPSVVFDTTENVLTIASSMGSSSYLLGAGPPAPERFWEDDWDLYDDNMFKI